MLISFTFVLSSSINEKRCLSPLIHKLFASFKDINQTIEINFPCCSNISKIPNEELTTVFESSVPKKESIINDISENEYIKTQGKSSNPKKDSTIKDITENKDIKTVNGSNKATNNNESKETPKNEKVKTKDDSSNPNENTTIKGIPKNEEITDPLEEILSEFEFHDYNQTTLNPKDWIQHAKKTLSTLDILIKQKIKSINSDYVDGTETTFDFEFSDDAIKNKTEFNGSLLDLLIAFSNRIYEVYTYIIDIKIDYFDVQKYCNSLMTRDELIWMEKFGLALKYFIEILIDKRFDSQDGDLIEFCEGLILYFEYFIDGFNEIIRSI